MESTHSEKPIATVVIYVQLLYKAIWNFTTIICTYRDLWEPEVEDRQMFPIEWVSFQLPQALVLTRFFSAQSVASKNKKFTDISTPASSESIDLIAWQHWRIHCIEKIKLAEPANSDWRDEFLMKCRITDWAKNTLGHATSNIDSSLENTR